MKTRNEEVTTFNLQTHLKGIAYQCGEAEDALREAGEITGWEFRPFEVGENVQYDKEAEQGRSLYHLAVTIVLNVRDWTIVTLANIKDKEPAEESSEPLIAATPTFKERMGKNWSNLMKLIGFTEDPEEESEEDPEESEALSLIRDAANLLRENFQEKGGLTLREKIQKVLDHMDDCESARTYTSSSGNTFLQVKDSINSSVKNIAEALTDERLGISLDYDLEEKDTQSFEPPEVVYERIESVENQIKLWKLQEACLKWRSRLEEITGIYFGTFNSSHGTFDDLLEEVLPSDRVIEETSMCMLFMQRVEKMRGTIVSGQERMDITINFTALVQAHNDKVVFMQRMQEPSNS